MLFTGYCSQAKLAYFLYIILDNPTEIYYDNTVECDFNGKKSDQSREINIKES